MHTPSFGTGLFAAPQVHAGSGMHLAGSHDVAVDFSHMYFVVVLVHRSSLTVTAVRV